MTIQIQGSARVRLEDGTMLRLNYDAHNGHSYTAVGRILIERNLVPREEMSMDRISQWMAKNPDQAKEVRGTNKSFVFFRITGLNVDTEPPGAQGVPLTPGRSIAVDRIHVYGTPFFIDAELPIEGARTKDRFRRLMVSQDTGSAIIGPARADLYFGAGKDAGAIAGRIRQQGRFVMLLPRELDMIEAGRAMPLPRPKPAIPAEDEKRRRPRRCEGTRPSRSKAEVRRPKAKRSPTARTRRRRRSSPKRRASPSPNERPERHVPATTGQRRGAGALAHRHPHRVAAASGRRKQCRAGDRSRRTEAEANATLAARHRRRIRSPSPKAPRAEAEGARARAARSPRQAAARARHAGDRRAPRSARPHPKRGARRAAALPAQGAGQRRQDRAGDHRQGRPIATASAACSSARCRCGSRCRNSAALVVGFGDAAIGHGGEGALYVRVRRARNAVSCPGRAQRAPGLSSAKRDSRFALLRWVPGSRDEPECPQLQNKPAQIRVLREVADVLLDDRRRRS